jgi:hypothetical protein
MTKEVEALNIPATLASGLAGNCAQAASGDFLRFHTKRIF